MSNDSLFRETVFQQQLSEEDLSVALGRFPIGSLPDAEFDPDGISVGDAVFSSPVPHMPCGIRETDNLYDLPVIDKVMGGSSSIACVEVAVVVVGICGRRRVSRVVNDEESDSFSPAGGEVLADGEETEGNSLQGTRAAGREGSKRKTSLSVIHRFISQGLHFHSTFL